MAKPPPENLCRRCHATRTEAQGRVNYAQDIRMIYERKLHLSQVIMQINKKVREFIDSTCHQLSTELNNQWRSTQRPYAQLEGTTNNSVSVVMATATPSTGRTKKFTHRRRVGSGTFNSPKYSPSFNRRMVQPKTRYVKLVDTETQTGVMDEQDEEEEEVDEGRDQFPKLVQVYRCGKPGKPKSEDDGEHPVGDVDEEEDDDEEKVEKDRYCSSPVLMGVMKSNERLDRDCSVDEKIDNTDPWCLSEESEVSWRMLNNDGVADQVALEEVATNAGWELCHVQKMLDPVEARRNPVSNLSGIPE
ncbi:mitogen-activated protein kinase kinase kinase [Culex quinquefasciatus]|uniref:Mitogen-activated protein kinase kinase kinase n=1 Tax=Culex quinquefasciatus TaxID=7176 RepID=B0WA87_CULQU|nr:mitogen-activated protein kinase kinase kinase [Culex quinquefasciatus]|eukprot:XP_001845621.1 mitogen-activated protein kinase kinase kinase [Culex quinquefasciatus]